jgi:predicted Rossmann fold flavoprotein
MTDSSDVAIIGAGAAGLAAAIFTRQADPSLRVVLIDGAARPGAKILVSGGGRCNVTNTIVTEADFWGGKSTIVRRILRAFPAFSAAAFFQALGVALHEEAGGKLFPDSNRARDVLDALLRAARDVGVELKTGTRVRAVGRASEGFVLRMADGGLSARAVVLATGGQSLPKTGSDGAGYAMARELGHTLVPVTPALAPLNLDSQAIHAALSGISLDVELAIWIDARLHVRLTGALLWTHFGVSGPVVLDASRHWARARLDGRAVRVTLNFFPGRSFTDLDRRWTELAARRPRATVQGALADDLPGAVAHAILHAAGLDPDRLLAEFARADRRRLVRALTEWPLPVVDTRGYNFAEVTAGGVALDEIDASTMESRVCPGLFLAGEILDVDGRIGGFNFQWSWSTAYVAARGVAVRLRDDGGRERSRPGGGW